MRFPLSFSLTIKCFLYHPIPFHGKSPVLFSRVSLKGPSIAQSCGWSRVLQLLSFTDGSRRFSCSLSVVTESTEALKYFPNFQPWLNDSRDRGDSCAIIASVIQSVSTIPKNTKIDILFI